MEALVESGQRVGADPSTLARAQPLRSAVTTSLLHAGGPLHWPRIGPGLTDGPCPSPTMKVSSYARADPSRCSGCAVAVGPLHHCLCPISLQRRGGRVPVPTSHAVPEPQGRAPSPCVAGLCHDYTLWPSEACNVGSLSVGLLCSELHVAARSDLGISCLLDTRL